MSEQKANDIITKAVEEDQNENYEEALRLYGEAVESFIHALKFEIQDEKEKEIIRERCSQYLDRAEEVKAIVTRDKMSQTEEESSEKIKIEKKTDKKETSSKDDEADSENDQILAGILKEKPNVKWDDVAGLQSVKDCLKEIVILPLKFPDIFKGRRRINGILLYGPPGTGKTYLVKALATEADNVAFFSITSADLFSKWIGNSEQLVKTLFKKAKDHQPSIIFVDDIDILSSIRQDGESDSYRRIKTEFLVQMEGIIQDKAEVVVLGATNAPWDVDASVRRRLSKTIHIPLPDAPARKEMFKLYLGETPHKITEEQFQELGEKSDGYSGADISCVVRGALMQPIRKIQSATHFKQTRGPSRKDPDVMADDLLTPCPPDSQGAKEMNWTDIPEEKLLQPILTMSDVLMELDTSKPTVNSEDLEKMQEFIDNFGQEA